MLEIGLRSEEDGPTRDWHRVPARCGVSGGRARTRSSSVRDLCGLQSQTGMLRCLHRS